MIVLKRPSVVRIEQCYVEPVSDHLFSRCLVLYDSTIVNNVLLLVNNFINQINYRISYYLMSHLKN